MYRAHTCTHTDGTWTHTCTGSHRVPHRVSHTHTVIHTHCLTHTGSHTQGVSHTHNLSTANSEPHPPVRKDHSHWLLCLVGRGTAHGPIICLQRCSAVPFRVRAPPWLLRAAVLAPPHPPRPSGRPSPRGRAGAALGTSRTLVRAPNLLQPQLWLPHPRAKPTPIPGPSALRLFFSSPFSPPF